MPRTYRLGQPEFEAAIEEHLEQTRNTGLLLEALDIDSDMLGRVGRVLFESRNPEMKRVIKEMSGKEVRDYSFFAGYVDGVLIAVKAVMHHQKSDEIQLTVAQTVHALMGLHTTAESLAAMLGLDLDEALERANEAPGFVPDDYEGETATVHCGRCNRHFRVPGSQESAEAAKNQAIAKAKELVGRENITALVVCAECAKELEEGHGDAETLHADDDMTVHIHRRKG